MAVYELVVGCALIVLGATFVVGRRRLSDRAGRKSSDSTWTHPNAYLVVGVILVIAGAVNVLAGVS